MHLVLKEANNEYTKKQAGGHTSDRIMLSLMWDVHQLEEINSVGKRLRVEVATLCDQLERRAIHQEHDNIARKLSSLRDELTEFVKGLTRHQRVAATHCLVVMISTEERRRKPYALPIQCLPCRGLKDSQVRDT